MRIGLAARGAIAAALVAGVSVAGCASTPTRFYVLDAAPASTPSTLAYVGPPLRVRAVVAPAMFDRPEVVLRTGANTVRVADNDRWASPLGQEMRRVLTADFAARLPQGTMLAADAPRSAPKLDLAVEVLSIRPVEGGTEMDAAVTVRPEPPNATALPSTATLHLSVPESSETPLGQARAISALLDELAGRIAADLGARR